MRKVIILIGLPASGKSTWAKKKCYENKNQYKRVNKDDLRDMIDDGKYTKENEKFILNARNNLIMQALHDGYDVVVDDTNLHPKEIDAIKAVVDVLTTTGIKTLMQTKFFNLGVEECIKRDLKRTKSVGKDVITDMYNKFIKPEVKDKTKK